MMKSNIEYFVCVIPFFNVLFICFFACLFVPPPTHTRGNLYVIFPAGGKLIACEKSDVLNSVSFTCPPSRTCRISVSIIHILQLCEKCQRVIFTSFDVRLSLRVRRRNSRLRGSRGGILQLPAPYADVGLA